MFWPAFTCVRLFPMDSKASTLILSSPPEFQGQGGCYLFDSSFMHKQTIVPIEFVWPERETVSAHQALMEPVVDLEGFFRGDEEATQQGASIIRSACLNHGFFQVINHGVDPSLIGMAHDHMDHFFKLPACQKLRARRMPGGLWGYSGAHSDRYISKLPWKETLSFGYHENCSEPVVVDFFKSTLGKDFEQTG